MVNWAKWLPSQPDQKRLPSGGLGIEAVRERVLSALDDCQGVECDRLRWRLHTAECAQDLYLLRSPLFQVVASQHCQAQAIARLNGLTPAFQDIMPRTAVLRL